MAERRETDCQKTSNNWYKFSNSSYYETESLYGNISLKDLTEIAKRSS